MDKIKLTKVGQISTEILVFDKQTEYLLYKKYTFKNNENYQEELTTYNIIKDLLTDSWYVKEEYKISTDGFYSKIHRKLVANGFIEYIETLDTKYINNCSGIPIPPTSINCYDLSEYTIEEI